MRCCVLSGIIKREPMKIDRERKRSSEVYTASLNDIMFFLLLFFLIISTMVTPTSIRVLLPNAKHSDNAVEKKNIQLVVTKDLRYYINDKEINVGQVESELSQLLNDNSGKEISVVLQADKSLELQQVVDLIDIGNKLNIKMVLSTKKNKT